MPDQSEWSIIYQRGVDAGKAGNFQEAINNFSRCINIDNKNSVVFIGRSNAYCGLKQYDKAMADIYSALALNQSSAAAYGMKALIELSIGDLQTSLGDYNKAILIDSNDSILYTNRGQIKRDMGDLEGALEDFNNAIKIDPNNTLASWCLSMCQAMKNSPEVYKKFLEGMRKRLPL